MTKDTQKKVFDKFYRVEKGNIHTIKAGDFLYVPVLKGETVNKE